MTDYFSEDSNDDFNNLLNEDDDNSKTNLNTDNTNNIDITNIDNIDNTNNTENTNKVVNIVSQDKSKLDNDIHMYKQARGKKTDLIITGLEFASKDETKKFLSTVKKKFGTGGCQKMIPEIEKDKFVFVFTGNLADKIKNFLVSDYGKTNDIIKIHG